MANKDWNKRNPDKMREATARYRKRHPERVKAANEKAAKSKRAWKLKKYGLTPADEDSMLARQRGRCLGCREPLTNCKRGHNVDHCHTTGKVRGLLCPTCNIALGVVKDSPATLRRLMAYLERDPAKTLVYVGGALKNPRVPEVGNVLRGAGYDAMDEWWTPGKEADENWQRYEALRGRGYREALRGRSATNTFLFDRSYIDMSDAFVLVMPAGKSAMAELGYATGAGIPVCLFLDGEDPDRYDIMPNFADAVAHTEAELLAWVQQVRA